jgi:hypothetical protein
MVDMAVTFGSFHSFGLGWCALYLRREAGAAHWCPVALEVVFVVCAGGRVVGHAGWGRVVGHAGRPLVGGAGGRGPCRAGIPLLQVGGCCIVWLAVLLWWYGGTVGSLGVKVEAGRAHGGPPWGCVGLKPVAHTVGHLGVCGVEAGRAQCGPACF